MQLNVQHAVSTRGPARAGSRAVYAVGASNGMQPLQPPAAKPPQPASSSATTARPSYRVSLFDALKFNGPAPELINGRLAMVGLLVSAVQESETGTTVLYQLNHVSLGTCLALAVWVYASLVPILKGVKQEAFGPFSPRAEITNGRAAMLGFVVLCALESTAGVPFF